jgi:hypothetical protein
MMPRWLRILFALVFASVAAWVFLWAIVIVGTPAATSRDELEAMPLLIVRAAPGDTWWELAAPCPVDQRVAVEWLTETAGVDADAPLQIDQLALTCGEVQP